MKERPILFSAPMVRATLEDRKTQTRRVGKIQNPAWTEFQVEYHLHATKGEEAVATYRSFPTAGGARTAICACPYGVAGDRLWVRETWRVSGAYDYLPPRKMTPVGSGALIQYGNGDVYENRTPIKWCGDEFGGKWRASIHMPRWASRITLEITGVGVERLQDISEEDAEREGIHPHPCGCVEGCERCDDRSFRECFAELWDSINGVGAWDENSWVWRLEFKKL